MNCRRLNEPPSTSATVLTVSVLARPGTPSSSTWPPASSATSTRSSIASWPTITRLISNSAVSSASWAARDGFGSSARSSAWSRRSSGVTCGLLGHASRRLIRGRGSGRVPRSTVRVRRSPPRSTVTLACSPGLAGVHGRRHVVGASDRLAVDLVILSPWLQAGLRGRAVRRRRRRRPRRRGPACRRCGRRGRRARPCRRSGSAARRNLIVVTGTAKPTPEFDAAAVGLDLRVDADHAAVAVEQRAAGVAGVDRGVGLDRVGDREAVGRLDRAPERGDDAARDRALEPERASRSRSPGRPARSASSPELQRLQSPLARRSGRSSAPRGRRTGPCRAAWPGSAFRSSPMRTLNCVAPSTTWSLVTMWPSLSIDEAGAGRGAGRAWTKTTPCRRRAWRNDARRRPCWTSATRPRCVGDARRWCRGVRLGGARSSCRRRRRRPRGEHADDERRPRRRRRGRRRGAHSPP